MDKRVKGRVILEALALLLVLLGGARLGLEALISPALPDTQYALQRKPEADPGHGTVPGTPRYKYKNAYGAFLLRGVLNPFKV